MKNFKSCLKPVQPIYRKLIFDKRYYSSDKFESLPGKMKYVPNRVHQQFYQDQTKILSDNRIVLEKIISKLDVVSEMFKDNQTVKQLQESAKNIYNNENISPSSFYTLMINYYKEMRNCFGNNKARYNTDFTEGTLKDIYKMPDNTQLFFTSYELSDMDLIMMRPGCIYPVWSQDIPINNFNECDKYIDGNKIDPTEVFMHDIGHAYIMKRTDSWLFENSNEHPTVLVEQWTNNCKWYLAELDKLSNNKNLYDAARLFLFDIVHDRGYQFDTGLLYQQFTAAKNFDNIVTKLNRGDYAPYYTCDNIQIHFLHEAKHWLIGKTLQLSFDLYNNRTKQNNNYIAKIYPPIKSYTGVPTCIYFEPNGKIMVKFSYGTDLFRTDLNFYL